MVGVDGEMEHGGASVHPMFGKPMRAAIGRRKAMKAADLDEAIDATAGVRPRTFSSESV